MCEFVLFEGRSVAQVSLRWLLQHEDIMASVIIGVRTLEQLEDNMDAADINWKLTPDQVSITGNESPGATPRGDVCSGQGLCNRTTISLQHDQQAQPEQTTLITDVQVCDQIRYHNLHNDKMQKYSLEQ